MQSSDGTNQPIWDADGVYGMVGVLLRGDPTAGVCGSAHSTAIVITSNTICSMDTMGGLILLLH